MTSPKLEMQLFNTESRRQETLVPMNGSQVLMYTCGPTVYNFAHIGNYRTYVFEDLLRRSIQFFGMKITQVMNLTDVDDKTIKGAIANGITLDEYTEPYKKAFFEDLKMLNIEPAEHYPAATDYINEMITVIEDLLQKKIAYQGGDGSIYYAISKFPRYGCLSHLHLDELQAGASERIASDEYEKENIADFVLWKAYDPSRDGKIFWDSPFGPGRPGWHLECSAMAMKILGPTIDIHVGGVDNMFPHHENEIAQSEAYSGKQFVKLWMHCEHLVIDNKKMSKSLGNFYTIRDLINKGYTGTEIRYILIQTHYKTQLNFTLNGLEAVKATLQRLHDFVQRLLNIKSTDSHGLIDAVLKDAEKAFTHALADDLNISMALAALFNLIREVNALCDSNKMGIDEADKVLNLLKQFNTVLGVISFEKDVKEIPQDLQDALIQRNEARKLKNWALSDQLRDLIANRGYVIEDTPEGTRLKPLKK